MGTKLVGVPELVRNQQTERHFVRHVAANAVHLQIAGSFHIGRKVFQNGKFLAIEALEIILPNDEILLVSAAKCVEIIGRLPRYGKLVLKAGRKFNLAPHVSSMSLQRVCNETGLW